MSILDLTFDTSIFDKTNDEEQEVIEEEIEEQEELDEASTDPKDLLLKLQMKRNQARNKLKIASDEENKRLSAGPNYYKGKEISERRERAEKYDQELKAKGIDPERYKRLHETQERLEKLEKENRKETNPYDFYSDDVFYKSFLKRQKKVEFSREDYEKKKKEIGEENFYGNSDIVLNSDVDKDRVELLVKELEQQEKKRKGFHRRRPYKEDEDVTYINDFNRRFNIKAERAYGKYTEEIKESLERGTAL